MFDNFIRCGYNRDTKGHCRQTVDPGMRLKDLTALFSRRGGYFFICRIASVIATISRISKAISPIYVTPFLKGVANRLPFATVSVISIPDPTTFDKSHAVSKWKQKEKCVIKCVIRK